MSVTQLPADLTVVAGMPGRTRDQQDVNPTPLTDSVISLIRDSQEKLPPAAFALLGEASHMALVDWMSRQNNRVPPSEGSSWDNVLRRAQLFVERLRAFELILGQFCGDAHLATSLAYGYCAMLLEIGRENAAALVIPFSFYDEISVQLEKISRAAMVVLSEEIKVDLLLVLSDILCLVAAVSLHFYTALSFCISRSISIDIRRTFHSQVETFQLRYAKVTTAISRQVLVKEGADPDGEIVYAIRSWLALGDPVIADLIQPLSNHVLEREEMTCRWMAPFLKQWKEDQYTQIHITGRLGSGKSVLSSVILEHFHDAADAGACLTLASSTAKVPAENTMCRIARSLLNQIFERSISNVSLLSMLSDAFECSRTVTDGTDYENLVWDTLERALACSLPEFNRIAIVVDGVDEVLCDEGTLLQKLVSILPESRNVKLITLGTQKPPEAHGQDLLEVTSDVTLDDISQVVRSRLQHAKPVRELPRTKQEAIFQDIAKASEGSFLWAKLASRHLRFQENSDQLRKTVDTLATTKPSIADLVLQTLEGEDVSLKAKQILLWLAIAQRPLLLREVKILASIQVDEKIVSDFEFDTLVTLTPVSNLVYVDSGLLVIRHGMIRDAVVDLLSHGKLRFNEDPHTDLVTRIFVYFNSCIEESSEPTLMVFDRNDTAALQRENPLLDYALRYWPLHLKQMVPFKQNGTIGALEKIANVLPMSTTFIRLLATTWYKLPTPEALSYHETVTELYRKSAGDNHVITLQCLIFMASRYRETHKHDKAIGLYYEAAMLSKKLLTERHISTVKLAGIFLELSANQIAGCHTEIMKRREECLAISVESHTLCSERTSEKSSAATRALADHSRTLSEEPKAEETMTSVERTAGGHLSSHFQMGDGMR